jgi:hypothetical protein
MSVLCFLPSRTGGSSLEALDLQLLGAAHLAASDDSDTASQAGSGSEGAARGAADTDGEVLVAAAEAGAGLKRSKSVCMDGSSPSKGRGLMLSMNYEAAAESINLELLASGTK